MLITALHRRQNHSGGVAGPAFTEAFNGTWYTTAVGSSTDTGGYTWVANGANPGGNHNEYYGDHVRLDQDGTAGYYAEMKIDDFGTSGGFDVDFKIETLNASGKQSAFQLKIYDTSGNLWGEVYLSDNSTNGHWLATYNDSDTQNKRWTDSTTDRIYLSDNPKLTISPTSGISFEVSEKSIDVGPYAWERTGGFPDFVDIAFRNTCLNGSDSTRVSDISGTPL